MHHYICHKLPHSCGAAVQLHDFHIAIIGNINIGNTIIIIGIINIIGRHESAQFVLTHSGGHVPMHLLIQAGRIIILSLPESGILVSSRGTARSVATMHGLVLSQV